MIRLGRILFAAALFTSSAFAQTPPNNASVMVPNSGPSSGGGGSGTVTSVATACGVSGGPITTTGTIQASVPPNAQVGTTYTLASTDCGKFVTFSNAASIAVTIPVASTSGFGSGFVSSLINEGVGTVTLTPTTSTIDGAATLTLTTNQSIDLYSDGTNYFTARGRGPVSFSVAGTSALGTGAITSATCASAVTTTATGVLTTDIVTASFNGDPHAVTGYIPSTAGMLTIIAYPTAGNVNFLVCNNTSSSITPGAITLNWRVAR